MKLWQEHQKARIEAEGKARVAIQSLELANIQIRTQPTRLRDEMAKSERLSLRLMEIQGKLREISL